MRDAPEMTSELPKLAWTDRPATGKRVTYVMTTRNKLAYLQESIPRFLEAIRTGDEELIVVDGDSTDGSREYLADVAQRGGIDWLLSERDYCEAHALNKALLAARGAYITILTDDDVFDFGVLRGLHDYLDAHPDVSVAYPSGADTRWDRPPFVELSEENDVLRIRAAIEDTTRPILFSGLGLTFRRDALPEIGLFDLNLRRVDVALSCRLTASPVPVAACTAIGYVRILNELSLTVGMEARNFEEKKRITGFYGGGGYLSGGYLLREFVKRVGERLSPAERGNGEARAIRLAATAPLSPAERIGLAEAWLRDANAGRAVQFVRRR
ncbi:MAG: glycosyltransferase [Phenylobacterium sp.]|nr:MAG: glycosyltransferase [Phenylobacterium sp.]